VSGTPGPALDRLRAELRRRHLTAAVAESCTGGLLAAALTDAPGSSEYFVGGAVTYANEAKTRILGVPLELLEAHGAVSRECAAAMAEGARRLFGTDLALAVTGIAGPTAEGGKPVGLTYVAAATAGRSEIREHRWDGDRGSNRAASVQAAVDLALVILS
jgi:PncC family amidohydrolase